MRRTSAPGNSPVSSRCNTTPSEYTSLAVETTSPRNCSGLAYSGVNASRACSLGALNQLRNPEIEQPDRPVVGHQYVVALEVCVHHQVLVDVLNGRAQCLEQLQSLPMDSRARGNTDRSAVR